MPIVALHPDEWSRLAPQSVAMRSTHHRRLVIRMKRTFPDTKVCVQTATRTSMLGLRRRWRHRLLCTRARSALRHQRLQRVTLVTMSIRRPRLLVVSISSSSSHNSRNALLNLRHHSSNIGQLPTPPRALVWQQLHPVHESVSRAWKTNWRKQQQSTDTEDTNQSVSTLQRKTDADMRTSNAWAERIAMSPATTGQRIRARTRCRQGQRLTRRPCCSLTTSRWSRRLAKAATAALWMSMYDPESTSWRMMIPTCHLFSMLISRFSVSVVHAATPYTNLQYQAEVAPTCHLQHLFYRRRPCANAVHDATRWWSLHQDRRSRSQPLTLW